MLRVPWRLDHTVSPVLEGGGGLKPDLGIPNGPLVHRFPRLPSRHPSRSPVCNPQTDMFTPVTDLPAVGFGSSGNLQITPEVSAAREFDEEYAVGSRGGARVATETNAYPTQSPCEVVSSQPERSKLCMLRANFR